ncbi:MAG TPA: cyanophycin synthetase, partial [Candidatus Saccharimonadales bacterium]|nr:cyanophycin synthetase [Candidatus Saccharimonadales bacterium]
RAAVIGSVEAWLRRAVADTDRDTPTKPATAPVRPVLVANVSDPGDAELVARLRDWPGELIATALVDTAARRLSGYRRGIEEQFATAAGPPRTILGHIVRTDPDGTTIEITGLDDRAEPLRVRLATAGRHNAGNALGVAATAHRLGIGTARLASGLGSFTGVGRRLERLGESRGVVVYDDYGHHPTAIRETLRALRQREPGRRLWAVYEPLTYHRTVAFLGEFAEALAGADAVAIAEIWAGRDPDRTIASAEGLAQAIASRRPDIPTAAPGTVQQTADWLADEVRPGDAVLVMGGGHSYQIGPRLLAALEAR